jgi:predicted DNA-binding transcriptional regulator AlpA
MLCGACHHQAGAPGSGCCEATPTESQFAATVADNNTVRFTFTGHLSLFVITGGRRGPEIRTVPMTTMWSCPDPDCPPTEIAPAEVASSADVLPEANLLTEDDVAKFLCVPINTLYKWRREHYGPPQLRIERTVRYRRDEVLKWMKEHTEPLAVCGGCGKTYPPGKFEKVDG